MKVLRILALLLTIAIFASNSHAAENPSSWWNLGSYNPSRYIPSGLSQYIPSSQSIYQAPSIAFGRMREHPKTAIGTAGIVEGILGMTK